MKRVLIITYYWPPAGGPGVQRWLKFVTYFKEFGIDPIVFIPDNPHYPITDESIGSELPEGIQIIRFPIKEPYGFVNLFSKKKITQVSSGIITKRKQSVLEKVLLWIRGNFFIPDARIGWVKPSINFLRNFIADHNLEAIITSGPPHSLHLIGKSLKEETGIKWVADFRDPWTTIHYHKSLRLAKRAQKKHIALESEVLTKADHIVVTSATTKKEFEKITQTPIEVITNGYDSIDNFKLNLDIKFTLSHIGSLLSNRNPIILWEVLSELCSENPEFSKDLLIQLAGSVSDAILISIQKYGLMDQCIALGYLSHQKAIQLQYNSQVLLLIEMNLPETKAIIPGKLFEYLAAKRPILAIGPIDSDVEKIIEETNSGSYFGYSEKEKLKKQISLFYSEYREGHLTLNSKGLSKFSRKKLTSKMSDLIKSL
ncbi:MAG: glycosyl transferase family 1 [Flavobacteriales bacterium]|nr:MAG: glycosyl transferase family 1 [Flavobacteriales bacterium]